MTEPKPAGKTEYEPHIIKDCVMVLKGSEFGPFRESKFCALQSPQALDFEIVTFFQCSMLDVTPTRNTLMEVKILKRKFC